MTAYKLLTPDDYRTTRWSGGTTTELAISPRDAVYADRNFLWRVSSALVEDETSDFTPLPNYDRLIATLEGSIILRHNGGDPITLQPYQVHAFDGGAQTACTGSCRDFNLMLRKGCAEGSLKAVRLTEEAAAALCTGADAPAQPSVHPLPLSPGYEETLIYCAEGCCVIKDAQGLEQPLQAGQALHAAKGLQAAVVLPCTVSLMVAQMRRI